MPARSVVDRAGDGLVGSPLVELAAMMFSQPVERPVAEQARSLTIHPPDLIRKGK